MNGGAGVGADLRAQLRLGVVMTGGVSLAVWMGGVALELDRLRREIPGSAYDELCRLAQVRPVIDIVAGTSAGGLNGTLLAAATAWESDLEDLRGVWLSAADLGSLLRKPGAPSPPSLLDGDGYFLAQTDQAITNLRVKGATPIGTDAARRRRGLPPVHLTVTSTLMDGNSVRFTDALGSPVTSTSYLGLYAFSTDGPAAFDQPGVVAQLARAARSSASFPMAFEASRIDAGAGPVDMGPVAEFVRPGDPTSTRYVLDGGLVANEPIDQVYDQIRDQPSQGPVRRVICYVSPLSGSDGMAPPPPFGLPAPDLLGVMTGTLLIPREQNIVRQLRAILGRSDDQRALSRARRALTIDDGTAPDLLRAAEALQPVISDQRGWLSLAALVDSADASAVPTPTTADAAAEGRRVSRRQALLLVQDLLRRSITRAVGDDLTALAEQRDAVSAVLASSLDADDPVRDAVVAAYDVLTDRVPAIRAQVDASPAPSAPAELLSNDLADIQTLVRAAVGVGAVGADAVWRAVQALDVLLTASSSSVSPNPQRIDLVQLSANAPNCFDGRSTPDAKLTGVQFNHFGAFYRGGWRANDWMWGRLDGAMRIIEMLVDPDALLATAKPIPELADDLFRIATGPPAGPDYDWLVQQPGLAGGPARIAELLEAVADPTQDRRTAVTLARRQLGRMVATRVQLQIARDELRQVRTYVAADRDAGAARTTGDSVFLEAAAQLDDRASAATVVEVFTNCLVGQDRLEGELGSDRMTALATQAMSVATGAIDEVAAEKGLSVLRPLLGALRWTFRLAHGLTSPGFGGSQLAKILVPMTSVVAAALMALAVWDDRSTALKLVLGLVLAGLSVAALLTSLRSWWTVALAIGAVVLLGAGLVIASTSWSAGPFVGASVAVVAAAGLAGLLLRRREGSPL